MAGPEPGKRQDGRLRERRIVITGAASGIGLATSRLFALEGARIAMIDRDAAALAEAAAGIGPAAHACQADVGDEEQVGRAIEQAAAAMSGIDGVVNAAGVSRRQPFTEMSKADWSQVLRVNLDGPFHVCSAALPHLRAAGAATVVNIASGVALRPIADCAAYAASKGGLIAFGKALAVELAPYGIRVNTVCPGIVETPMIRRSIDSYADPEAVTQKLFERRLLKRFGQPQEIAHAVLFLSNDECAYVTGSVFAIDGGGTMH
ncbi:MAG: SDR family oxidoreductase [Burkholderiales bacterium]|nr:SDR family oxidoreductase [Burkholderiales bacterium]ODU72336.1 MAG: hypothetical protein ABT05_00425 [Lautropia sp. SCN 66-9]